MSSQDNLPSYSAASKANSAVQVGNKLICSEDYAWTSALLEVWRHPPNIEAYSTIATPDQAIVVTTSGRYYLESFSNGVWKKAHKTKGMAGATAPMQVSRLRLQASDPLPIVTTQIYLPSEFIQEAGDEYRGAGRNFRPSPLDFLSITDAFVYEAIHALARGMECGAPDLYCNTVCRTLAVHLLLLDGRLNEADISRQIGNELTDRRLARVLDFISHHATQAISIDQLAREAGISRFHFVRLFKSKVGVAPHEYLTDLRLKRAALLLISSDLDIASIASTCGYQDASRFAQAFRKQFSSTPSTYRNESKRSRQ